MLRKAVGLVVLVCAGSLLAADVKDKGKVAEGRTVQARVVKVDPAKNMLTVAMAGKQTDFAIGPDTRIVGPKGGVSKKRLRDDRLQAGANVTLVLDASGRMVKEVRLPVRAPAKKDKGKAPKDKTK